MSRGLVPPYLLAPLTEVKSRSSSRRATTAFQNPRAVIPNQPRTKTSNHALRASKGTPTSRRPKTGPARVAIFSALVLIIGVSPLVDELIVAGRGVRSRGSCATLSTGTLKPPVVEVSISEDLTINQLKHTKLIGHYITLRVDSVVVDVCLRSIIAAEV